jgi:hypothetical protein
MSHESAPDVGSLRRGRFHYFPVVPGRLEFAAELRRTLLAERPRVVAVELPFTLEDAYLNAVARLPQMSVILSRRRGGGPRGLVRSAAIPLPRRCTAQNRSE